MKKAILVIDGQVNNAIFDAGTQNNADNWYYPYWYLKQLFEKNGIELNTADVNSSYFVSFELHMDVHEKINDAIPCYAMLYETAQIRPINQKKLLLDKYHRIFTWRDDLVDGRRYVKLNLPNKIIVNNSRGWSRREKLCCLISGNKSVNCQTPLELYSERVRTIRWFEKNAPQHFDLFGAGWDAPAARPGLTNRVLKKLRNYFPKRRNRVYFPSYRGKVASKLAAMEKYRFSICYENVAGLPGYITEKIWDSFFAGCVPVYWGASNITTYIPEDCFIDRRKFKSHEELYRYMNLMTEPEYTAYQDRISAFLSSPKARPFSAEAYAETIVTTIMKDLEIAV